MFSLVTWIILMNSGILCVIGLILLTNGLISNQGGQITSLCVVG